MRRDAVMRPITLAITGHRLAHPSLLGRAAAADCALETLFDLLAASPLARRGFSLNTMLADGADQMAARQALTLGWPLKAILPFGAALTCAIGAAKPRDGAERRRALLAETQRVIGSHTESANAPVQAFVDLLRRAQVEASPEHDQDFAASWIEGARSFSDEASQRYALAAQSASKEADLLVAVWDGASTDQIGGTGHTVVAALKIAKPVIWIEPAAPETARLLHSVSNLRPASAPIGNVVAAFTQELQDSEHG